MAKVIFHIDLNAFFASAEIIKNHSLEGQPLVVGGLSKRSVVCTANYEARKYGVTSAMPIYKALELCPHLLVIKGDYEWYETLSKRFLNFIKTYCSYMEVASIDECYIDVTELIKKYKRPLDLAWEIQTKLKKEIGLSCSIGIAPTKFLAKMASDMKKPMGITVIRRQEIDKKLWPLSIDDMFGIGKKTAPILKQYGIETIGDIADTKNEAIINKILGKNALQTILNARGYGNDTLVYNTTIQSLSQSTTINHDVNDYNEIKSIIKILATSLSKRAKNENIEGKMISISIRYYDFRNVVRSTNLEFYTNSENTIFENALLLLDKNYENIPIRHLGIALASFDSKNKSIQQLNIFNSKIEKLDILDELNEQLNSGKLMYASNLVKKN